MRRTIKRALLGALIGGGLAFAGATVAQAAETSGEDGTASGTQALINVTLPITVGGNGISVLGDSSSSGAETPATNPAPATPSVTTGGTDGIASGTQGLVSVAVPVTVGGNAISVLGDSESTDASASAPAPAPAPAAEPASAPVTSGDDSILGGTQAIAPIEVPITVSGNAISVLGDSQSTDAGTTTGTSGTGTGSAATTNGDDGIASGTQVQAPVQAPITVGGNAISVLGDSQSTDAGTATGTATGTGTGTGATTTGDDGILGGTQAIAPIEVPITVGGNAISVLGDSQSTDAGTTTGTSGTGTGSAASTNGDDGIASGTQVQAPVQAPITVGGNAISVLGDSQSTDAGTTTGTATGTGTGTGTDATTTGDDGIASGTQVIAPIGAPITAGGNAISVLGDSQSSGSTVAAPTAAGTDAPTTSGLDGILGGTQIVAPIDLPLTLGGNAVSVVGDSTTTGPTGPVVPTDPTDPTDPTEPGTPGTTEPGDGTSSTNVTTVGFAAGIGAAPAATSVSALAVTGSTTGGLWIALLALITGAALAGTAALRRRTARA